MPNCNGTYHEIGRVNWQLYMICIRSVKKCAVIYKQGDFHTEIYPKLYLYIKCIVNRLRRDRHSL